MRRIKENVEKTKAKKQRKAKEMKEANKIMRENIFMLREKLQ